MMSNDTWDLVIRNAKVFDGSGERALYQDIAVRNGLIAARGEHLPVDGVPEIVDAQGQWLLPGMLDIHTHLDLEVEIDPRLTEVVRHGTTTVLMGNCSLGTCFGTQATDDQEPIVDCFTRVENIPKSVLRKCSEAMTWRDTESYLTHFDTMSLGPNVATFVPHSMLRIEVMGLEASVSRAPTETELQRMEALLEAAMQQGYLGLSTDGLPFHYLSNDPNTEKRIPTQFASFRELRRLLKVVRKYDRVWQTTPIIENRLKALGYFLLTSGRLFGKTLKTSALSAIELTLAPRATKVLMSYAKLLNSRLFKGNIHFQALGTNFRIWSDGIVSPLFEELQSTAQLIAKEYDDRAGRLALLKDPVWIADFRRDWLHGRTGDDLASWKAARGLPDNLVIRELSKMTFDRAPVDAWVGETLAHVMSIMQAYQGGQSSIVRSEAERAAFEQSDLVVKDEADFMLYLMRSFDKDFRFWADVGNVGNTNTLSYLLDETTLPGFNDSGAHITNMAFFDCNLMSLKWAQQRDEATVAKMIRRLTAEPAAFFGLDAGTLDIGAKADMVLLDPAQLHDWHTDDTRKLEYREIFEHEQMVNRPAGIVLGVWVAGERVWTGTEYTESFGSRPLGRYLRAA